MLAIGSWLTAAAFWFSAQSIMHQTFALVLVVLGVQLIILFRGTSEIAGMLKAKAPALVTAEGGLASRE